jgi:hypothetical protein
MMSEAAVTEKQKGGAKQMDQCFVLGERLLELQIGKLYSG